MQFTHQDSAFFEKVIPALEVAVEKMLSGSSSESKQNDDKT